jgi:hypothetical protein
MPLATSYPVLKTSLISLLTPELQTISEKAFKDAMTKFKEVSSQQTGNEGKDVFKDAVDQASLVFSSEMLKLGEKIGTIVADQVNIYSLTALITIPPGQVVTGIAGTFPVVAAVTTPMIGIVT